MTMKNLSRNNAAASPVVSREVPPVEVNTDSKSHTRLGWWIVVAGVGGFLPVGVAGAS